MKKDNKDIDEMVNEICQDATKAELCTQWKEFNGFQWARILTLQPQLSKMADKYSAWVKLDNFDWCHLLCEQPDFMNAYLKYKTEDMTAENWLRILKLHPQFLNICPAASALSENEKGWCYYFTFGDWLELLAEQPQLEDKAPWESEKVGDEQDETVDAWLKLIVAQPHFARRFDWSRAKNCTDGEIWKDLLLQNREYEKYCPWDKLPAVEWWPLFKYCPQYFEKCQCASEVPPRAWGYLLCQRPELAERFFRWSQLTVNEWASLLKRQPQLTKECPCIDKVKELPEDEFDTDGLLFPAGHELDMVIDLDFRQWHIEHTFEELQAQLTKLEESINDKPGEEKE